MMSAMNISSISWWRAALGAVLAEVGQIGAAFGWVAFYSYMIAPGQPIEHYQAYAQASGPWVSIIAGIPIFYSASRWIARSRASALALWSIFVVIDGSLFLLAPAGLGDLSIAIIVASYLTKIFACYVGGAHADAAAP
jgi:hypothetical protein